MPGLMDILRPQSLGSIAQPQDPEAMRLMLRQQLQRQGRSDINVNALSPEQMMMLLKSLQMPTATTGIRG